MAQRPAGMHPMTDSITTPIRTPEDADAALRPKSLAEFVGQAAARENLRSVIESAKARGDALDHVLFFGPPGLGTTTLAQLLARSAERRTGNERISTLRYRLDPDH